MKGKSIAYIGVLSSLAIVLGYLEQMIPLSISVPGVKLGLSNICVLLALYTMDSRSAFSVAVIKSLACGILFWGAGGMVYGVSGALLAFIFMALVKKANLFGIVGISVVGAVFHNVGQLAALFLISGSFSFMYYLSVLGISGVIMGIITGVVASMVLNNLNFF